MGMINRTIDPNMVILISSTGKSQLALAKGDPAHPVNWELWASPFSLPCFKEQGSKRGNRFSFTGKTQTIAKLTGPLIPCLQSLTGVHLGTLLPFSREGPSPTPWQYFGRGALLAQHHAMRNLQSGFHSDPRLPSHTPPPWKHQLISWKFN